MMSGSGIAMRGMPVSASVALITFPHAVRGARSPYPTESFGIQHICWSIISYLHLIIVLKHFIILYLLSLGTQLSHNRICSQLSQIKYFYVPWQQSWFICPPTIIYILLAALKGSSSTCKNASLSKIKLYPRNYDVLPACAYALQTATFYTLCAWKTTVSRSVTRNLANFSTEEKI